MLRPLSIPFLVAALLGGCAGAADRTYSCDCFVNLAGDEEDPVDPDLDYAQVTGDEAADLYETETCPDLCQAAADEAGLELLSCEGVCEDRGKDG